ncbi:MAG: hypothetical protein ABI553_02580 [Chloroflexota bacterium]
MQDGQEPVTSRWVVQPAPAPGPWVRVGVIAAVLWLVVGLAVSYLSAQAVGPTVSAWLALLTGPVMVGIFVVIVGRRAGLRGMGNWIRAGFLAVVTVILFFSAAIFFAALGGFLPSNGSSGIETLAFGTGGSDCTMASMFVVGDPIRSVAEF